MSDETNALDVLATKEFPPPDFQGPLLGGVSARWWFPNGYGASVVRHYGSYGQMPELAVIAGSESDWHLVYDTSVTSDVIGRIETAEELATYINQIRDLPPRLTTHHIVRG